MNKKRWGLGVGPATPPCKKTSATGTTMKILKPWEGSLCSEPS